MTHSALGRWSSLALVVIGLAYIVALLVGFSTRGLSATIVDPLLAIMEVLTLIAAPFLLVMMAAVHARAPSERKITAAIAFAFMTLTTGLTSVVHFVQLTAMRQLGAVTLVWPSVAYAAELLAWDVFLGLSLVFAAFAFNDGGRERGVRRTLLVCAVLVLLGAIGPAVGNMRLQLLGVFGYGGVFPVVCLMLWRLFRDDAAAAVP